MTEFIFKRDFPDVLRPEFERYFEKYLLIIPKWVNSVTLHYQPQPEDYEAIMEVIARTEYRTVDIIVYSDFLMVDKLDKKEKAFLHEFCHVFYAQLHRQALGLADLLKDEIAQSLAYEGLRMGNEAATEDTCTVLSDLLEKISKLEALVNIQNSNKLYKVNESVVDEFVRTTLVAGKATLNSVEQKQVKLPVIANNKAQSAAKVAKTRKKVK